MPTFSVPSSLCCCCCSSSTSSFRFQLLLSLLILLPLLMNTNAALLLPLDSALFAGQNGLYAPFYRRIALSNAATANSQNLREFNSQSAEFDLSKKRSLHAPALLPLDKSQSEEEIDQFVLSKLPLKIASDGKSLSPSSVDQSTLQCFCCRAFVCRRQICPCSKFLI